MTPLAVHKTRSAALSDLLARLDRRQHGTDEFGPTEPTVGKQGGELLAVVSSLEWAQGAPFDTHGDYRELMFASATGHIVAGTVLQPCADISRPCTHCGNSGKDHTKLYRQYLAGTLKTTSFRTSIQQTLANRETWYALGQLPEWKSFVGVHLEIALRYRGGELFAYRRPVA